jgi:hypothetical protein
LEKTNWELLPNGGNLKSQIQENFLCKYKNLFNPKIDEVFGGSIMCYIFKSSEVDNVIFEKLNGIQPGGRYASYPHTLNLIYSLNPEKSAVHIALPLTINFWHIGVEWGDLGYQKVVTQGLGFLLFELFRLGYIEGGDFKAYFDHYLNIAEPSLIKILDEADNVRDHFDDEYIAMLFKYLLARYRNSFDAKALHSRLLNSGI